MTSGRGFLDGARTYHQGRRKQYRPVMLIGPWKATIGQAGGTMAGMVAGFIIHTPFPWGWAAVTAAGLTAGSYFFPKPNSNPFKPRTEAELAAMARPELLSYAQRLRHQEQAMQDPAHEGTSPEMPSAVPFDVLRRQADAAKTARRRSPALTAAAEMSLADLRTWNDASSRHEHAVRRWSQYELDPEKQIRYPAMADTREAPTAAMIRAMKQARNASESGNAQDYARAVDQLTQAIAAAEAHARKHQIDTDEHTPPGGNQ